ncbi:MAG: response regulator [Deltaproteobacteria bacterium]|jgi:signal transduction histidine kinase/ActR/RegA family two-component response regulator|nr:response regulator [Deltaproteobacteria bacterium]
MKNQTIDQSETTELSQEVVYLRRLCENSLGRLLLTELQSMAIRQELEQKRLGFSLIADLVVALKPGSNYTRTFNSVSRRINAALNMQRTAVLSREPDGRYRVTVLQGYEAEEEAHLKNCLLEVDEVFLKPLQPVLVTGADPQCHLAEFRQSLALPFFISVPVMLHDEPIAILVTGRLIEQPPFLPRLGQTDLETVQTVGIYLTALLTGQLLEQEEARKQDLEEIMQTVFRASLDGYMVWDSGNMERISSGALQLLELKNKAEFISDFSSFGLTNAHLNEIFKRVLNEGPVREELLLRTKSGLLVPCEITHLPLQLHHATCLLSYIRDLRDQKKHEEALLIAKEQAEVAAQAKSAFLANMSHEIRTPMNAIAGLTHLIYDDNLSQQQKDYLAQIEGSFNSLLRIVNDILEFSTISTHKLDVQIKLFRLDEVMSSVIRGNQPSAEEKGLRLLLPHQIPPDLFLNGDPVRLKQILNNLIDNAIKFTNEGQITVSVKEVERLSAPEGQDQLDQIIFEFSVTDTGIGFDLKDTNKLFSAFSQADNSSTRTYGGTGLGLAISKELVELMGGKIRCHSQIGQGSTFTFTARLGLPKQEKKIDPVKSDRNMASQISANIKGSRILLVEDNEVNQLVAKKILEKAGLVVTIAENGLKALGELESNEFDLVLMDIQMPEMDGLEATRRIRGQAKYASLPILAMTAHALRDDRELSFKVGMNGHITKPINLRELFGALSQWLPSRQAGNQ